MARVGRPPTPRDQMLAAADALFREGDGEAVMTMDAVAAAAGVGKGTIFRAFGDRDGLLDALAAARFEPLRRAVEGSSGRYADELPAADRIISFLDALLTFKLENANLMRARESAGGGDLRSERYRWMHEFLRELLVEAYPGRRDKNASYTAHTLLTAVRSDLLDELLAEGTAKAAIRRAQREQAAAILADWGPPKPSRVRPRGKDSQPPAER